MSIGPWSVHPNHELDCRHGVSSKTFRTGRSRPITFSIDQFIFVAVDLMSNYHWIISSNQAHFSTIIRPSSRWVFERSRFAYKYAKFAAEIHMTTIQCAPSCMVLILLIWLIKDMELSLGIDGYISRTMLSHTSSRHELGCLCHVSPPHTTRRPLSAAYCKFHEKPTSDELGTP